MTAPKSLQELRRFLGIFNFYRRFIPNCAAVLAPLDDLLRGSPIPAKSFSLTVDASTAFNNAKSPIASAAVLAHPVADAAIILSVDASDKAAVAVLHLSLIHI